MLDVMTFGTTRAGGNGYARDPRTARALWARAEELVGESFPV
jgi:hypothetical protein